jgi:large subunit ribosomal protein L18
MVDAAKARREGRIRRHARVRKRVSGTPERPRLAVFRSNRHIYAQLIDDVNRRTLAAAGSRSVPVEGADKTAVARLVGTELATRAKAAGISTVVFDRGGFQFHGRVKALADAARENGLVF